VLIEFYMFNFRSEACTVPGVSDLLLHTAMQTAHAQGKSFMNLSLGIHTRGLPSSRRSEGLSHSWITKPAPIAFRARASWRGYSDS